MQEYQTEFIRLALARNALRFGEFTLKSGRVSPYFFNAGAFDDGASLAVLGRCYAAAIAGSGLQFDMLFGPAYKGIPLVAATAAAMYSDHGRNLPFAFNRKEAKTHGEGGSIVGRPLAGRVLIIDDVITAGTAIRESIQILRAAGATPAGVALALDRQERGRDEQWRRQFRIRGAGSRPPVRHSLHQHPDAGRADRDAAQRRQPAAGQRPGGDGVLQVPLRGRRLNL